MDHERCCRAAMARVPGLGPAAWGKLKKRWGLASKIWEASERELREYLTASLLAGFLEMRHSCSPEKLGRDLETLNIKVVIEEDDFYPELLQETYNPPFVLFCRGNITRLNLPAVAVVGSRRATPYGRKVARTIGRELAEAGVMVVSGMARGIDAESHAGCLEGRGMTAAVLGCGPDVIYPRENRALYEKIVAHGVVVSEFWPGTSPEPRHFPMRNRIISGMSQGVAVVEAEERSGAMITVNLALEQGREVFAVPGPVTSPFSEGTNRLIQEGARMVRRTGDILEELGIRIDKAGQDLNNNHESGKAIRNPHPIMDHLGYEPVHIDHLQELSGLSAAELSSLLVVLEMEGRVRSLPGNRFVLA